MYLRPKMTARYHKPLEVVFNPSSRATWFLWARIRDWEVMFGLANDMLDVLRNGQLEGKTNLHRHTRRDVKHLIDETTQAQRRLR